MPVFTVLVVYYERALYNRKYVLGILYAQPVRVTASTIPKTLIDAVQIAQTAVRCTTGSTNDYYIPPGSKCPTVEGSVAGVVQ